MPESYRDAFMLSSAFLRYPDSALLESLDEIELTANSLPTSVREPLLEFLAYLKSEDIQKLQEDYVRTFDFDEKNSLYLTYPTFGTRPERGAELLRIKTMFSSVGLYLESRELPDYLPVVLEFLSMAPDEQVKSVLSESAASMVRLAKNLESEGSPYSLVLRGCLGAAENLVKLSGSRHGLR